MNQKPDEWEAFPQEQIFFEHSNDGHFSTDISLEDAVRAGAPSVPVTPLEFREFVRCGTFRGPTNGCCPGFLQCNLVVVPAGVIAFEFLLFCQRNPIACPLLEVCEGPTSFIPNVVATMTDLRTDIPKYVSCVFIACERNTILYFYIQCYPDTRFTVMEN
jgi:hypothetical protein